MGRRRGSHTQGPGGWLAHAVAARRAAIAGARGANPGLAGNERDRSHREILGRSDAGSSGGAMPVAPARQRPGLAQALRALLGIALRTAALRRCRGAGEAFRRGCAGPHGVGDQLAASLARGAGERCAAPELYRQMDSGCGAAPAHLCRQSGAALRLLTSLSIMTDKEIDAMRDAAQAMFDQAIAEERHEFGSFFLSRFLGMQIAYENDSCIVSFEVKPPMYNPQGSLHGGMLATALDISMGHLLNHRIGA